MSDLTKTAMEEGRRCAEATLDVRNAYNSGKWKKIIETLVSLHAPNYLMRRLYYHSDDRQ